MPVIRVHHKHAFILCIFILICVALQQCETCCTGLCSVCVLLQSLPHSEPHRSCKTAATALFMSLYPCFLFWFYWPQIPDFSKPKNRVLQTVTLLHLCFPLVLSIFLFLSEGLLSGGLSALPVLCSPVPDKYPHIHSDGSVCVHSRQREMSGSFISSFLVSIEP